MKDKKLRIICKLFVLFFSLAGCKANGSHNAESCLTSDTPANVFGAESLLNDSMATPITAYGFESCDKLVSYLKNEYSFYNKKTFCLLRPNMLVEHMGNSYVIRFDDEKNGLLLNSSIKESFYIYDNSLGTLSDPTMDVPYYSMKFECLFYPFKRLFPGIHKINAINVSETKIQIKCEGIFAITVSMRSLKETDYAIKYLMKNLFVV